MTREEFSTRDVAKILGISERQAIDWAERGLIIADLQSAQGLGSRRRFSYEAVLMAMLALKLKNSLKIPREQIKRLAVMPLLSQNSEKNEAELKNLTSELLSDGSQDIKEYYEPEILSKSFETDQPPKIEEHSLTDYFSDCYLIFDPSSTISQKISKDAFYKEYFSNLILQKNFFMLVIIDLTQIKIAVDEAIIKLT